MTVIKIDAETAKNTCPYCKMQFRENDDAVLCSSCQTLHHVACWEENKGCTTSGCAEQHHEEEQETPSANTCSNCGEPMAQDQAFCTKCGTNNSEPQKKICSKCGSELQDSQDFCSHCGQKYDVILPVETISAISLFNMQLEKNDRKKKKRN